MHLAQKLKKDMSETEGSLHSFTTVYLSVNLFLCMLMLLMIHYFLNLRIHVFHQFGNILRKKKKISVNIASLPISIVSFWNSSYMYIISSLLISFSYFPSPSFFASSS